MDLSKPLDEAAGARLGEWAQGGTLKPTAPAQSARVGGHPLIAKYEACQDGSVFDDLEAERSDVWLGLDKPLRATIKEASNAAAERIGRTVR
jgi:hypothetical protein